MRDQRLWFTLSCTSCYREFCIVFFVLSYYRRKIRVGIRIQVMIGVLVQGLPSWVENSDGYNFILVFSIHTTSKQVVTGRKSAMHSLLLMKIAILKGVHPSLFFMFGNNNLNSFKLGVIKSAFTYFS